MPWALLLNPRVIGALVAVAAFVGIVTGAYFKGKSVERVKWELAAAQAKAEAEQKARDVEAAQAAELSKVSNDYEAKLKVVHSNYGNWVSNLRLRDAKPGNKRLPEASTAARKSNATTAAVGNGSVELDRQRIAEIAVSMAQDLDACREQVYGLQGVINGYLETSNN